jgi:hypothetical protein
MKKLILLGVIALAIFGCEPHNPQPYGGATSSKLGDYNVKVIDNCEYIEYSAGLAESSVYAITHKGNCKYCKERNSK